MDEIRYGHYLYAIASFKMINILVLTKDNSLFLSECVRSLTAHTVFPFQITVIDNSLNIQSVSDNRMICQKLGAKYFKASKNRWVLSIHEYLKLHELNSEYFCVTDDDVLVPEVSRDGLCWLALMLGVMEKYSFIGKLGASLESPPDDLHDDLKTNEKKFKRTMLCPEIYDAPVDSTLAIYRYSAFIGHPFSSPFHMSQLKPKYLTGRLSCVICRHIGWSRFEYARNRLGDVENSRLIEKLWCFFVYNGHIPRSVLSRAPFWFRCLMRCRFVVVAYWYVHLLILVLPYMVKTRLGLFDRGYGSD